MKSSNPIPPSRNRKSSMRPIMVGAVTAVVAAVFISAPEVSRAGSWIDLDKFNKGTKPSKKIWDGHTNGEIRNSSGNLTAMATIVGGRLKIDHLLHGQRASLFINGKKNPGDYKGIRADVEIDANCAVDMIGRVFGRPGSKGKKSKRENYFAAAGPRSGEPNGLGVFDSQRARGFVSLDKHTKGGDYIRDVDEPFFFEMPSTFSSQTPPVFTKFLGKKRKVTIMWDKPKQIAFEVQKEGRAIHELPNKLKKANVFSFMGIGSDSRADPASTESCVVYFDNVQVYKP